MDCPFCKKAIPQCETCGPVKKVYEYGGTFWCKECLKLVKAEREGGK